MIVRAGFASDVGVTGAVLRLFRLPKFLRQRRIAQFLRVEVDDLNAGAVLHFAFAKLMQLRTPLRILLEIIRHMFGEKNVSGIRAIHHTLRDVDSRSGDVRAIIQILDFIDRSTVNAHPDAQFRMALQSLADFQSAQGRGFRSVAKNQCAAIPGRQAQEFAFRFGEANLLRSTHDFLQLLQQLALLANQPLGVADNVDEQDMPDLETKTGLLVGRHERLSLLKSGSILHCKAARVETGNAARTPLSASWPASGPGNKLIRMKLARPQGRKLLRAVRFGHNLALAVSRCEKLNAVVASSLLAAFLFALGLAASPQLHARFHPDAGSPNHECAVTLIASGKYEQADAPPLFCAPQPAVVFERIPALAPVWVAAPFLGARIFEHAPPALS